RLMTRTLTRISAGRIVLACALAAGAPAHAQTSEPGSELPPDVLRAVERSSLVRVRTERFSAKLERPRLGPAGIFFDQAEIEFGDTRTPDIPQPIPFRGVLQVDAFRPHTLLAAGIGFVFG